MELTAIVLGSAAVGAVLSSLVNGLFNFATKKRELALQDILTAARLAELKHQQIVVRQQWAISSKGQPDSVDLWDPLQTVIGYLDGLREYRDTGRWEKADASHRPASQ